MNTVKDKKRNSFLSMNDDLTPGPRVGARQREMIPLPRGGGYQDNCTYSEISYVAEKSASVILAELKEMNLRDELIEVAEKIGADNFVKMWHYFDCCIQEKEASRFRITFPSFEKYSKHQQKSFARQMAAKGHSRKEIIKKIDEIGRRVSIKTLDRAIQEISRQK